MGNDRSAPIWGVGIAFFIISWIAVGLRIWVRAGMIKSFGRDDWTMLATQLMNTAYLACQLGGLIYGTGRHIEDLEPARAETALTVCIQSGSVPLIFANPLPSTGCSAKSSMCLRRPFSKSASDSSY
jgi:hypothetical protein